jgi:hypothetical protein
MPILPRPGMRRILSHPGNPICTAIVHTPPKIPSRARDRHGRTGPRGPATVRWQTRFPRRGKRRQDTAGNWRAIYMPGHPRDLPARLMTALDLRGTRHRPLADLRPPAGADQPNDPLAADFFHVDCAVTLRRLYCPRTERSPTGC